jgi:ubiquinone/menaquinone biosynthesis C-methylase UbiE
MDRLSDRLVGAHELLDGPLDDPAALAANLRDLERINRWFGGVSLSRRAVRALAAGRTDVTLVDVGTGAADIPLALLRDGVAKVVAVDSRPEVRTAAVSIDPRLATTDRLAYEIHDGRALPYPDASFDIGHVSMVLHHLERPDAVAMLVELARVTRAGVVVNDLERGRLGLLGAGVLTRTIARAAYTRHDAPLSVRRAWRRREVEALLQEAGLRPVARFHAVARHRYAIAAMPPERAG